MEYASKDKEEPLVKTMYLEMIHLATVPTTTGGRDDVRSIPLRLYEMLEVLCKCNLGIISASESESVA
jgi:hypothetical protein